MTELLACPAPHSIVKGPPSRGEWLLQLPGIAIIILYKGVQNGSALPIRTPSGLLFKVPIGTLPLAATENAGGFLRMYPTLGRKR